MKQLLLAVLLATCTAAFAQAPAQPVAPAQSAMAAFSKPVLLSGTLGEARIQMQLRPKEEFEGGIEGQYFVFGQSHHVLVAGEIADDQLFMEESINGRDVSGDWVGVYKDGVLSGEWQSVAGESMNFRLEVQALPPPAPAAPARAAKTTAKATANPKAENKQK